MAGDQAGNWRQRGGWSLVWEVRRWARSVLSAIPGAAGSWLRVRGHGFAECGRDVAIMEYTWIDFASEIHIGDHVGVNRHVLMNGQGGIWIGDWSMIGPRVTIYTQNHDMGLSGGPRVLRSDTLAPVRIGIQLLDWLKCHHPRRRLGWGECGGGSRGSCHEGRASRMLGGWGSGEGGSIARVAHVARRGPLRSRSSSQ